MVTPTLPEMSVDEFQQHGEEVIKVGIVRCVYVFAIKVYLPKIMDVIMSEQGSCHIVLTRVGNTQQIL